MSDRTKPGTPNIRYPSSADLQKRFEDLLSLKQTAQDCSSSEDFGQRLNCLQQLRNGASVLRTQIPEHCTNPSLADVNSLLRYGVDGIENLVKEKNHLRTRTGFSGPLAGHSFQSPFSLSSENGEPFAAEPGQNRPLKELQELLVKNSTDILEQIKQTRTELWNRLNELENVFNKRFDAVERRLEGVQNHSTDSSSRIQQTVGRVDEQCNSIARRIDAMDDRQNRKIEELLQRQSPQTSAALPHVVHVNFGGSAPNHLEGTINVPTSVAASRVTGADVNKNTSAPAPSTPAPAQIQSPTPQNAPFVVHVPKKEPSSLERLVNTAVCSPVSVTPETKGTSTVTWGAPVSKPQGSALPTQKSEKPSETPTVVKSISEPTRTAEAAKPGLFSGFQGFGLTNQPAADLSKGGESQKIPALSAFQGFGLPKVPQTGTQNPFSAASDGGGLSFAELANSGTTGSFQKNPSGFPGSGSKLFGSTVAQHFMGGKEADEEDGEDGSAEYEPNVSFKPLVNLPEVDVKTGEEDYEKVFVERSKLLRFDRETQEWKERGLGDITVQRRLNPESGKVIGRVLMRWEKTFKICANHAVLPSMKLERKEGEKNLVRWYANDFADGELKVEYFAARFKLAERAEAFKAAFERVQKEIADQETGENTNEKAAENADKKLQPAPQQPSLSELFKPKGGSWNCADCYTSNPADKTSCLSCSAPKPGSAPAPQPSGPFKNLFQPNITGASSGFGFNFGAPAVSDSSEKAPLNLSEKTPGFSSLFGAPAVSLTTAPNSNTASFANLFGAAGAAGASQSGGFSFPGFDGTPQKLGGFSFSITSPPSTSKKPDEENDEEEAGDVEAERTDVYFEPIVKLPENVDLATGEENETELYSQRAKLYRYTNAEWKERGLGDLKMLKDKSSNKIRLLMRREKILKVCCNHYVRDEMELRPMPGTKNSWVWDAMDFSEGTLERETLAVRFKHEAHAKEFKELFDQCKAIVAGKWTGDVKEFQRVQVNENEIMMPIVDGGKKAIAEMGAAVPETSTQVRDALSVVDAGKKAIAEMGAAVPKSTTQVRDDLSTEQEHTDVQKEIDVRRNCYGDKVYSKFGVLCNGRGEVDAIVHPSEGLFRLKSQNSLQDLISVDERSRGEFLAVLESVADRIDIADHSQLPQSIHRYFTVMRIKELGEDEMWRAPIFEREATLYKQAEKSRNWENLKSGRIRIARDSEYDSPFFVEFLEHSDNPYEAPNPLAIHGIAADAHFEKDLQSNTAKWKANDEVSGCPEKASFKVTFTDRPSLMEFERVFLEGVDIAKQVGVLTTDVYNA